MIKSMVFKMTDLIKETKAHFFIIPNELFNHFLTAREIIFYTILKNIACENDELTISNADIAELTKISLMHAVKLKKQLREKNLITVTKNFDENGVFIQSTIKFLV